MYCFRQRNSIRPPSRLEAAVEKDDHDILESLPGVKLSRSWYLDRAMSLEVSILPKKVSVSEKKLN